MPEPAQVGHGLADSAVVTMAAGEAGLGVLGSIARRHRPVPADTSCAVVDQMFRDDTTRQTVIVDRGGGAIGAVGRSAFYMQLAGPKGFGYALHSQRPVGRLVDVDRLVLDADLPLLDAAVALLSRGGSGADEEVVVRWPDHRVGTAPIAELYRCVAGMLDERMRTMSSEHDMLDAVVRSTSDAIGVLDVDGTVRRANPAMCRLVGSPGERIGARWSEDDNRRVRRALREAADAPSTPISLEMTVDVEQSPATILVVLTDLRHDPHVRGVVVNASDRTALDAMRRRLEHDASHDPLTDLPNRAALRAAFVAARARGATALALLYVDVDRFKSVNDSLGHRAGDDLLIAIAHRLRGCVRGHDVVARLGGDEFVVLATVEDLAEALGLAQRILSALAAPVAVSHTEVPVRASIGVIVDDEGRVPDDLLRDADAAMYDAKVRGGGQWALFDHEARLARERRATLERRLARAVAREDIAVVYQPIVDLASCSVVGVEALARWTDAGAAVSPEEFIPLAEEAGLIHALGASVLARACADVAALDAQLGLDPPLELSVNLSGRQLGRHGVSDELLRLIAGSGIDTGRVTLELTESSLMLDGIGAARVLEALAAAGIRLALDDFGTGYSSLAQLHQYRFDRLKIDRAFVAQLHDAGHVDQTRSGTIASSIVALGGALGIEVVAEGIETHEQLDALRALGCRFGQGWLFSPPASIGELVDLLRSSRRTLGPLVRRPG